MMKKWMAILTAVTMLLTMLSGATAEADGILRQGDRGEEVIRLQQKLIELEYLEGEATGLYDEATADAVLWFQREHDLLETGMADPVTRRLLETETVHARQEQWNGWAETEPMGSGKAPGFSAKSAAGSAAWRRWTVTWKPGWTA